MKCFFVTDIHGKVDRYKKLFDQIVRKQPEILFIGGDIFPSFNHSRFDDFIMDYLIPEFEKLQKNLKSNYPRVYLILGNDDPKTEETKVIEGEHKGLWKYIHNKKITDRNYSIYGYSNIPPSPFLYKDWERYDVSRYVDPGCIHPTEGKHAIENKSDLEYATIKDDLIHLSGNDNLENAIFLFHSPPYKTHLDRAALDGQMTEHVPLDVHVGSIAIQRFIEEKQPFITLHGHIHESSRITGYWKQKCGKTWMFSAAYEFPQLAIIHFNTNKPENAERYIL